MIRFRSTVVAALVVGWSASAAAESPVGEPPVAVARPADEPLKIDGVLDDAAWTRASKNRGFIERKPVLRGKPPVDTWFAVLFDRRALYIGVWCGDDSKDIRARTTTRDSFQVFADDALSVKLDPTHDHRTTVGLVINPAGGRLDYRGVNEKDFRREFDTIWKGKAKIVKGGWSAEFAIPWTSLGIDPKQPPKRIGLNFSRDHPRRNATYDWALMPPPYRPVSASLYGHLDGLDKLATLPDEATGTSPAAEAAARSATRGSKWAVIPYLLGGFRDEGSGFDLEYNAGIDVIAPLGDWRARLTVNTDFAQVDVDDQVLNLTRFGLFMPEKREFFVRDVDLFSFGRSGSAQGFYSRKIGLDASWNRVPILAGTKVVGHSGPTQHGLIAMATGRPGDLRAIQGVYRPLYRFESGSTIGGLITGQVPANSDGSGMESTNATVGVDATLRGRENPLLVEAFAIGSSDQGKKGYVGALDATWRGLLLRPRLGLATYSRDFQSDLGFFLRTAIHQGAAGLAYEPRFKGDLEKLTFDNSVSTILDFSGKVLDTVAANSTTLTWKSGYWIGVHGDYSAITAQSDFDLGDGTTVPAGEYTNARAGLAVGTPGVQNIAFSMTLRGRQFFGGTMLQATPSLTVRPGGLLRFEVYANLQKVTIDNLNADFTSVLVNGRAAIGFSPELNLDLYAGWNRIRDAIPVQARLRWTWRRASDLFVVYQANLDDHDFGVGFQSLLAKITFRYP